MQVGHYSLKLGRVTLELGPKIAGRIALMAATFGKVEEFDSKKEEWSQYVERLQHFLWPMTL